MAICQCAIHGRQPCRFASPLYIPNARAGVPPAHLVVLELRSSFGGGFFWVDDEFLVSHGLSAADGETVLVSGDDPVFEVYADLRPSCSACDAEYRQKFGIALPGPRSSTS